MKILVTGAAGFIGSHVADACVEAGHEVVAVDSLDPAVHRGPPGYLRADVQYHFGDLRGWEPDRRFDDVEAIVHLAALGGVARAAREPAAIIDANCGGTARLVALAPRWPGLSRIVLVSSFSVYGAAWRYACPGCGAVTRGDRSATDLAAGHYDVRCPACGAACGIVPLGEDVEPAPLEAYAASKLMQELCFRGFTRCPVHVLRCSSVYGSRLRLDDGEATIIAKLAGWIGAGVRPRLFEDGHQLRDWVHVGDVVAAVLRLLDGAAAPALVNACSGTATSLVGACAAIARALGVASAPDVVGGYRPGDMRHCLGDPARFRALIGRAPLTFAEGAPLAFSPLSCAASSSPAT